MTTKMTKKDKFAIVKGIVEKSNCKEKAELLEFIDKEIAMLNKRSGKSGETTKQKENEVLKVQILDAFKGLDKMVTISEFQTLCPQFMPPKYSNQKLSAMFRQLHDAEPMALDKKVIKKKSYFFLPGKVFEEDKE